jgi:DNA-binding transcriptional MerR regulator
MAEIVYRIKDLALRLGCSLLTVKRWEKKKYIPQARRDARGWRTYTSREMEEIIKNAQKTNHFLARKNYSSNPFPRKK